MPAAKPCSDASATCKPRTSASAASSTRRPRAGKRPAAPFAKRQPADQPKKPGRKPGNEYGPKAHRQPPSPEQIDETHEAPLPEVCPGCGGPLDETHIAHQFQVEVPRRPIHRPFNIHVGRCRQCRRRVQGRHPLQTSDALGAAAAEGD